MGPGFRDGFIYTLWSPDFASVSQLRGAIFKVASYTFFHTFTGFAKTSNQSLEPVTLRYVTLGYLHHVLHRRIRRRGEESTRKRSKYPLVIVKFLRRRV